MRKGYVIMNVMDGKVSYIDWVGFVEEKGLSYGVTDWVLDGPKFFEKVGEALDVVEWLKNKKGVRKVYRWTGQELRAVTKSENARKNKIVKDVMKDVEKAKKKLSKELSCENFGDDEIRKIEDKYFCVWYNGTDIERRNKVLDIIAEFKKWCWSGQNISGFYFDR